MSVIASLLVKVGADIKELEKGMSRASRAVEDTGKKMEQMGKTLTTRVTAPLMALGAVAVRSFGIQEKAELQLRAALAANGREVEKLFGRYNEFAKEMQRVSVVGDETTLSMLAQAESFGLSADNAERAVKNSIAMQSAFGVNAQSALRYTAALEEGNATMLTRYIPSLREITDESERVAEAQRILGNAFSSAEAEAQGSTGQMIQMKNAVGDLMEQFGEIIADAILPFVRRIKELAERFQELDKVSKEQIVVLAGIAAGIGPVLLGIGKITLAVKALTAAIMANPYLAVAAGVLAIGTAVYMANRRLSRMGDIVEDALNTTPTGTQDSVDKLNEAIAYQEDLIEKLISQHKDMGIVGTEASEKQLAPMRQVLTALNNMRVEAKALQDQGIMPDDESENINNVTEAFTALNEQIKENQERVDEILNNAEKITKAEVEEAKALQAKNQELEHQLYLRRLLLGLEDSREQIEPVDTSAVVNAERMAEMIGRMSFEPVVTSAEKLPEKMRDAWESMQVVSGAMEFANSIALDFTSSFGHGMANVVVQGEKLVDVLENIGKLLLSSVIQKGLAVLLTGGLGSGAGFFGSGGGLFGKIFNVNDALITSSGKVIRFNSADDILASTNMDRVLSGGGTDTKPIRVYGVLKGQDIHISSERGKTSYGR